MLYSPINWARIIVLAAGTQVPVAVTGSTVEWTWVMSRSGNPPPRGRDVVAVAYH